MSCPICDHNELSEGTDHCPKCGSDLEVFTHIENAYKENTFQKKSILVLTALFGIVLVSWGSVNYFSGNSKNEIIVSADTTNVVVDAAEPLALESSTKPVEEFVKENEEVKPEVAPIIAETKVVEASAPVAKAPVVKERPKVTVSSEGGVIIHKVKRGDSFWTISQKYFKNGSHAKQIAVDNNLNPKKSVAVGTKLKINK